MSQLELNKGDEFIHCVDVSMSMKTADCPGGMSRIEYLKEQLRTFFKASAAWDESGASIITFGQQVLSFPDLKLEEGLAKIDSLKAAEMATDTAGAIQAAYDEHKRKGSKQTFCFLYTDGEPSDREAVKRVVRNIANEIPDEHAFAIQVLTCGVIDPGLASFLKECDDDIKAKHDIFDVKAIESVNFEEACAGALDD